MRTWPRLKNGRYLSKTGQTHSRARGEPEPPDGILHMARFQYDSKSCKFTRMSSFRLGLSVCMQLRHYPRLCIQSSVLCHSSDTVHLPLLTLDSHRLTRVLICNDRTEDLVPGREVTSLGCPLAADQTLYVDLDPANTLGTVCRHRQWPADFSCVCKLNQEPAEARAAPSRGNRLQAIQDLIHEGDTLLAGKSSIASATKPRDAEP